MEGLGRRFIAEGVGITAGDSEGDQAVLKWLGGRGVGRHGAAVGGGGKGHARGAPEIGGITAQSRPQGSICTVHASLHGRGVFVVFYECSGRPVWEVLLYS